MQKRDLLMSKAAPEHSLRRNHAQTYPRGHIGIVDLRSLLTCALCRKDGWHTQLHPHRMVTLILWLCSASCLAPTRVRSFVQA